MLRRDRVEGTDGKVCPDVMIYVLNLMRNVALLLVQIHQDENMSPVLFA